MPERSMPEYGSIFPKLASWIARWGLTDSEIAAELGVASLDIWKADHPDFASAIDEGRKYWETLAESSMQKLIKGYEVEETVLDVNADGTPKSIKKITRHVPPNAQAVIFQLKSARIFEIAKQLAGNGCPSFECPFDSEPSPFRNKKK